MWEWCHILVEFCCEADDEAAAAAVDVVVAAVVDVVVVVAAVVDVVAAAVVAEMVGTDNNFPLHFGLMFQPGLYSQFDLSHYSGPCCLVEFLALYHFQ